MLNGTAPLLQKPVIGIHLIVGSLLYVLYVMMIAYVSDNDELIILPWMSDIKYPFFFDSILSLDVALLCLNVHFQERVGRRCGGLRVLNSYWVAQDSTYKYYEVVLMDPSHKVSMTVGRQDELELKLSVQQVELELKLSVQQVELGSRI
jgi:hypothetical protein